MTTNTTPKEGSMSTTPIEGITRCLCGSKYWNGTACASCADTYRPEPTMPKPGTIRWLSALGFPGFSRQTAKRAWELHQQFPHVSMHAIVFGGRELEIARYEARFGKPGEPLQ